MRATQITQNVTIAIAVVAVIVAGYWGHQILEITFPEEERLIVAEVGTVLSVGAEDITVQNGSARVITLPEVVKSMMIVIYLLLSLLSLCGVAYLFAGFRAKQSIAEPALAPGSFIDQEEDDEK